MDHAEPRLREYPLSGLDEIKTENVGKLQVAFTFAAGTLLGALGAPAAAPLMMKPMRSKSSCRC